MSNKYFHYIILSFISFRFQKHNNVFNLWFKGNKSKEDAKADSDFSNIRDSREFKELTEENSV